MKFFKIMCVCICICVCVELFSLVPYLLKTTEEFVRRYRRAVRKVGGSDLMSPSATQAYDTIWTIAITLRNAMHYWATNNLSNTTIDQFSYKGAVSEIMRDNFVSIMGNLDFMGVSVSIFFSFCQYMLWS